MCKDWSKQPDELDGWDFGILLSRECPMISIVPHDNSQDDIVNTISIRGYTRVASWRNGSGELVFLFEKTTESGG